MATVQEGSKEKRLERRLSVFSRLYANQVKASRDIATWVFGLVWFDEDIGFENVQSLVKDKLLTIPRFRCVLKSGKKESLEELPMEEIDMDYHVKKVDQVLSAQQIQNEYCGTVYKHFDFDVTKPLWQFTYFPKVEDGRSLLLTNVSHALGDGVSQVEVLFQLLDEQSQTDSMHPTMSLRTPAEEEGEDCVDDEKLDELQIMDKEAPTTASTSEEVKGPANKEAEEKALRPPEKRKSTNSFGPLNRAKIFMGGVFDALFSVFGTPDTPNPLMRKDIFEPSTVKSTSFAESVPLSKIKEIKSKFHGATVNDIVVALLTLTLNAYFEEHEEGNKVLQPKTCCSGTCGKPKVRASFPINARKRGEHAFRDGEPRNKLAMGLLRFETQYPSRIALVYKIKRTLDKIKLSPSPFIQQKLANFLIAVLPKQASSDLFQKVVSSTTAILSNVCGPQKEVYLAGHRVSQLQFLLSMYSGLYLGMLSYKDEVSVGVCMDESLGSAQDLAKHWKPEFDKLYEEVMQFEGMIPRPKTWYNRFDHL